MSNSLTPIIPTILMALDTVARERVGFLKAVDRDSSIARAAVGQSVSFPIVGAMAAGDIAAAATGPDPSAVTIPSKTLSIEKSRSVSFFWEGEEQLGVKAGGTYQRVLSDQFAQAMRTLCNEVESDIAAKVVAGASRAYGTAGTTPFSTAADFTDFAGILALLEANGAPPTDLHLVLSAAAMAKIRGVQSSLFKANEAGSDVLLRTGSIAQVEGFFLHHTPTLALHTKGTGASYVTDGAHAKGATSIKVKTGTGTVLAGDVVTITGNTTKYVVTDGIEEAGTFKIAEPGLAVAVADGVAVAVGNTYTPNIAFNRLGVKLATRAPAMPEGGDSADDVLEMSDPVSGLGFQVALYRQRRRVAYEVGLAWGASVVKSPFVATLLG